MLEPRVLIIGTGLDARDSARSLEMLAHVRLPGATKFVVTTGKLDTGQLAKTFNVETGYPAEPASLQTLARWAEPSDPNDFRFRDGYDLYCLRGILSKNEPFDFAAIVYDVAALNDQWPALLENIQGRSFLTFGSQPAGSTTRSSILFDLRDRNNFNVLELAWELYASGTVYAISPYSLDDALATAAESQRLKDLLKNELAPSATSAIASVY